MKIAITAQEDNLDSLIDQRFGRCKYFLIAEVHKDMMKKVESVENQGAAQGHGAGIRAAQQISDLGVDAVITGSLGPNASEALKQAGIKSYHSSGKAEEALNDFIKGGLKEIDEVAEMHSGITEEKKEAERIFFPLLDNKGDDSEISSHFGHAPFFGIYDTEKKELKIIENKLDHSNPEKSPIDQITEAVNPTTIFAKGIGGRAIMLIKEKGLALKTGDYSTVKEAIKNLDSLEEQTQSCGH